MERVWGCRASHVLPNSIYGMQPQTHLVAFSQEIAFLLRFRTKSPVDPLPVKQRVGFGTGLRLASSDDRVGR